MKPGCVIVHTVQFSTLEIPVEQFSEASFKLPHADNDLRAQPMKIGRDWSDEARNYIGTCTGCAKQFRGPRVRADAGVCRRCHHEAQNVPCGTTVPRDGKNTV